MSIVHLPEKNAVERVEPEWVLENLKNPGIRFVECGKSDHFYGEGHLPGAVFLDLKADLLFDGKVDETDSLYFDYLCLKRRISRDSLCVFYGDGDQDPVLKTLSLFRLFGYNGGKILHGGKREWIRRGFPLSWKKADSKKASTRASAEIVSVRCYSHEW